MVTRFDENEGGAASHYLVEDGLADNIVKSILEDREGNFWFGTQGGGISRYDPSFVTYSIRDGLATAQGGYLIVDREGNLWLNRYFLPSIARFDGRIVTTYRFEGYRSGRPFGGDAGWLDATGPNDKSSLIRFTPGSNSDTRAIAYTSEDGLPEFRRVTWTFRDRAGYVWSAATGGGLVRSNGATWEVFGTGDGLPSDPSYAVLQDLKGGLWFGFRGVVAHYSGGLFTLFTEADGLPPSRVTGLIEAFNGHIWLTSYEGVSFFDGQTWQRVTPEDGLAHSNVRNIIQDSRDHLWFATGGGGVSRYDGKTWQTLTRRDGLPSNHVRGITEDLSGDIWISTSNGLGRYRAPVSTPPSISITSVLADKLYDRPSEVSVATSSALIAIDYRSLSFKTRPEAMIYRHRLVGHDDEWTTTHRPRVEYEDLPIGSYTFQVEAVDRDLVYSEKPATLALTVHLPYERIGWASVLAFAIGLVAWQSARVIRRDQRLRKSNESLSDANNELFQVNVDLEREQVLERLRGQAQGMQSSEEFGPVVEAVYRELNELGLPLISSNITMPLSETETQVWITDENGQVAAPFTRLSYEDASGEAARERGDAYVHTRRVGEEMKRLIREQKEAGNPRWQGVPEDRWPDSGFSYRFLLDRGATVGVLSEEAVDDDILRLIGRFGQVFGFAHQRWQELKQKETQNRRLAVEASVQRLRADVQSMDETSDFERILSLVTKDMGELGLGFASCEIDLLNEPIESPTMEHFELDGFRYTTFTLAPNGKVETESYDLLAPFPAVNRETIERFIEGEPWQGRSGDRSILEVAAGSYGRLRMHTTEREEFTEDEIATVREFANAIALGYARYLDIREIQLQTERKSAFLASMSHELRTPMNAIKGFTNLVLRRAGDVLPDLQKENLHKVDRASDHLLAMINDLLDLSKIEAGRMDVSPERFDVRGLIAKCCDTVSPLIQEGVELRQEVADDVGEANTDRARVQQMVINLLSNAIKFTDSGSVTVTARREQAGVSRQKENLAGASPVSPDLGSRPTDNCDLVIAITDTGKGIPEDEIATLFDEYRQVEGQSESKVQRGTGLGLSITKKFAELLGDQ